MAAQAWESRFGPAPYTDIDVGGVLLRKAPERGCASVAQSGIGSADENGSHPAPLAINLGPSNCIDTPCDDVQAAGLESMLKRALGEAKRQELLARHHTVLRSN
jgi:hypothetical protein